MKKIINQPETLVEEMCCGMAAAHPELEVLRKYKIIKKYFWRLLLGYPASGIPEAGC